VRDQETGFFVRADQESIAWGLGAALADSENAGRIARNGRNEAETRFSWNVVAEGTLKLYESIH
jgi:glycosyltransferase involved in cell wall biosynthesis